MNKLSFRARALDATKSLPIYREDEIPDNADCSLINRAVPQMPTGMEKEEESEQHLQRAICAGTVIPTPEVFDLEDHAYYCMLYPEDYKMPRQLIYMQPFSMEADIPDYDMDSEDEDWVNLQTVKLELTPDKFEEMMDRLEKGSGQTVVTLQEAKALIKEDDDLIIAVYDYWLNKRLKTQHPLIPQVRTEARFGVSNHNPYIAFRRRTEKMQTRKNRKNDESSYEKMLKLKRDLSRAVTLLEMVKRREKSKRELLHLSIEVFEKRYQAGDFSGQLVAEALSQRPTRPAFTPLYQPNHMGWPKDDHHLTSVSRKEKRHYKKRRHKAKNQTQASALGSNSLQFTGQGQGFPQEEDYATSEDENPIQASPDAEEAEEDGAYAFRRRLNCDYHAPTDLYPWSWCLRNFPEPSDKRFRFCHTSLPNCTGVGYQPIGRSRRRIGRGGRVLLDRMDYQGIQQILGGPVTSETVTSPSVVHLSSTSERPENLDSVGTSISATDLEFSGGSLSKAVDMRAGACNPENHLIFRPRTPPEAPNQAESVLAESMEIEELNTLDALHLANESEEAPASPNLQFGKYLTAFVDEGEPPLVFEVEELLAESSSQRHCRPEFIYPNPDHEMDDADLLDQFHVNLINSQYLDMPPEYDPATDPWTTTDVESTEFLSSSPHSIDVIDLCSDPDASGTPVVDNTKTVVLVTPNDTPLEESDLTQALTLTASSKGVPSSEDSVGNEVTTNNCSEIANDSDSSALTDAKRTLYKDDKENDRITIVPHPRDRPTNDEEHIAENGDASADSSEECMIVEEQRPNFLLAPKSWVNCIT